MSRSSKRSDERQLFVASGAGYGSAPTRAAADAADPTTANALFGALSAARATSSEESDTKPFLGSRRKGWCGTQLARIPRRVQIALLVLAVVLVVIGAGVPAGVYFGAPLLAKNALAATELKFISLNITSPRAPLAAGAAGVGAAADAGGFTLSVRAQLSGLSIGGTLAALPLTLSVGGADVLTFTLPAQDAVAGQTTVIETSATASVLSLDAFRVFANTLLQAETVTVRLVGQASLATTISGVTITVRDVPFDKSVSVPGARGLVGSEVTYFSLTASNLTTALVNLNVSIPNASPVGIYPLGDIGVGVYYAGQFLGTAQAANVSLLPSARALVSLAGVLVPQADPAGVAALDALITAYLRGVTVNVTAVGLPLGSSTPLFAPIISALNLTAGLQGTKTPLVASIAVSGMDLVPLSPSELAVGLNATVGINSPLGAGSPLTVKNVGINVTLEGEGMDLGRLFLALPVPARSGGGGRALAGAGEDAGADAGAASPVSLGRARRLSLADAPLVWRQRAGSGGGLAADPPETAVVNVSLALHAALTIDDSASGTFGKFITTFINRDAVSLALVGREPSALSVELGCVLGDLTVSVPIEARTTVPGIAGFSQVDVESFAVVGVRDAGPDGPAAIIVTLRVLIGNPSPATFPLGDTATLGIFSSGFRIGAATAVNQTLAPGLNRLVLNGTLSPPPESLGEASDFFSDYLNGLNGTVTVVGEGVTLGPGRETPAWLEAAVRNISLAATVPGAQGLQVLTDFSFLTLDLSFKGNASSGYTPVLAGSIAAAVHLPFSIPVTIPAANVSLALVNATTGAPFALLTLRNQAAAFTPCAAPPPAVAARALQLAGAAGAPVDPCTLPPPTDGNAPVVGSLAMVIAPVDLQVLDEAGMAALITAMLLTDVATLRLVGTADPTVGTAVGMLSITNVSVSQPVSIKGMGGFAANPPVVHDATITATSPNSMSISVLLDITNPSQVSGRLGPVTLDLAYAGVVISTATVDSLDVVPGLNVLAAHGVFALPDPVTQPAEYAQGKEFIARYLSALTSEVVLSGSAASSPISLMQPALSAFTVGSSFPPIEQAIIVNATLYLDYKFGDPIPAGAWRVWSGRRARSGRRAPGVGRGDDDVGARRALGVAPPPPPELI